VIKPLNLDGFIDQEVKNLSGGELQRVALALCLGKPADVYLIDEPSAYLDSEQRIVASKIIKRFILHGACAARAREACRRLIDSGCIGFRADGIS